MLIRENQKKYQILGNVHRIDRIAALRLVCKGRHSYTKGRKSKKIECSALNYRLGNLWKKNSQFAAYWIPHTTKWHNKTVI